MSEKNKRESINTSTRLKGMRVKDRAATVPRIVLSSSQKSFLAIVILASILSGYVGGIAGSNRNKNINSLNSSSNARQQVVMSEGQLISDIAKAVGQSVVSVNVTSQSAQRDFFGFVTPTEEASAGTGVIISSSGYVITNRHVVPKGATSISVTLSDGTELGDVEVVGRTNENDPLDIAFLKIKDTKGKQLKPVALGDSSKMQVGDRVVAIGNALGRFQNTVTEGIISGYGRSIQAGTSNGAETLQNLFQTDAAINQGNSGGPLVNVSGEMIGINTAIAGGQAQNIGFAIPINDARGLIKSVLDQGKLLRPYLGVRYVTLTDDYSYTYNLSVKRGAYLAPGRGGTPAVLPDSPAAKAGLKEKDVITKINDDTVDENNSLPSLVGKHSVGDEITLTIVRDSKEEKVKVKLEAAPQD